MVDQPRGDGIMSVEKQWLINLGEMMSVESQFV